MTWESGSWVLYIPLIGFLLVFIGGTWVWLHYVTEGHRNKFERWSIHRKQDRANKHNARMELKAEKKATKKPRKKIGNPINKLFQILFKKKYLLDTVAEEI